MAAHPMPSCLREMPGPLEAVMAFTPPMEAPVAAVTLPISSSIWMKQPPSWGRRRAMYSAISEAGVMG